MIQVPKSHIQFYRKDMPQIKQDQFEKFANKFNVEWGFRYKKPIDLKATQIDFDEDKIDAMVKRFVDKDPEFKGIINISMSDDVLDGHHRWIAALKSDQEAVLCRVLFLPTQTALDVMHAGQL